MIIFTVFIQKSNKYPARIKVHAGNVPMNFCYQEKYTEYENHVLCAQYFAKKKNISGLLVGERKNEKEYIFLTKNKCFEVDVDKIFFEEKLEEIIIGVKK